MEGTIESIALWLAKSIMMRWGVHIRIFPRWIRALAVSLKRAKPWVEKSRSRSETNGEALPLFYEGEEIYTKIRQLGLPTPELQFVSPRGDPEPIGDALERMTRYLNLFCILAESDPTRRFGRKLFEDSKEYLEAQCKREKTRYMVRRIRGLVNDAQQSSSE